MSRVALVDRLVQVIEALERPHTVRVALDGPDAAGKTTLADELAHALRLGGRAAIRASVDGFHRPRAERYRCGDESPEGYYEDSFDSRALCDEPLDPLGPRGSREYRRAVFDFRSDAPRSYVAEVAPEVAVLVFDGIFLLRPELLARWDLRIFVSVGFDETLRRALTRDGALFGSQEQVERRYRSRYIPAQRLYLAAARPTEAADVVVCNDDPARPCLRRSSATRKLTDSS